MGGTRNVLYLREIYLSVTEELKKGDEGPLTLRISNHPINDASGANPFTVTRALGSAPTNGGGPNYFSSVLLLHIYFEKAPA